MTFRSSILCLSLAVLGVSACAQRASTVPPGTSQADKFLYDRGTQALQDRKWLVARDYFRQLVDNYPQSQYRPDAKLGLGDTYIGENTSESLILAANEFREFLTFFPRHARADYAQYKLGMSHFEQMLGPDRDQTETKAALKELEAFVARFPDSSLMPEVKDKLRQTRDRLSESHYRVGLFYFRSRWYVGAIDRFRQVLKEDPEYTSRDAVYFYLAESLVKVEKTPEALPYYQRLIDEFQQSEFLEKARARIDELKSVKKVGADLGRPAP
ncbi:MAG: outer membrane protein assembly factor BamD [Acidobacteria bacterium]|nr:outer membrane protein assembly factor BamD [Acidobacteriota bacterium]